MASRVLGKPVVGQPILVLSEERRTWIPWSTCIDNGNAFSGYDGRYAVRVPPGRYYVIAVPRDRMMERNRIDPQVLESLVRDATAVLINDDEIRTVDLRILSR